MNDTCGLHVSLVVYVLLMDRSKRLFLLFDSAAGRRVWGTRGRSRGRRRRRRRERRRSAGCHRTGALHSRHGESDSYPSAAGGRCFEADTLRLKPARRSGSSGHRCWHRHGPGEHRGQHGAGEGTWRWGWRQRDWQSLRRSRQRFQRLSDAPNIALVSGYFTSSDPMLSTLRRKQDVAEIARRFRGEQTTINQTELAAPAI